MSEARSIPIFFIDAGRNGHLYDHLTCYVTFPPRSYDEMEYLDAAIWRYLYPYQVISDIRAAEGRVYAELSDIAMRLHLRGSGVLHAS